MTIEQAGPDLLNQFNHSSIHMRRKARAYNKRKRNSRKMLKDIATTSIKHKIQKIPAFFIPLFCLILMLVFSCPTGAETASPPHRIALLYPQSLGLLFILDLTGQVVCLPRQATALNNGEVGPFYRSMAPAFEKAADSGQTSIPNIETILSASPDFIIAADDKSAAGNVVNTLEQQGIRTIRLQAGFGTIDAWLKSVESLGKMTGRAAKADSYRDFFRARLALVASRTADIPKTERIKVAMINTTGNQMVLRGSRATYGLNLIRLAGGRLLDSGDDPADSAGCAELLFAFDPDLIIDDAKNDIFYRASWWESLRAVKEKRVYKTPADDRQAWVTNWFLPAYSPVGILWLAKKFYPERFADIDLRAEHENFCRMLYGRPFAHAGTGFDN